MALPLEMTAHSRISARVVEISPVVTRGQRFLLTGVVQGVGFRPCVQRVATALGLTGTVCNLGSSVQIDLWGVPAAQDAFLVHLQHEKPHSAQITGVVQSVLLDLPPDDFRIVATQSGDVGMGLATDLAPCEACLAELDDPHDRRFRYALTSCATCGPRPTMTLRQPFDRENTTLAPFPLCPACAHEYADPRDRRFHAQGIACPICGPQVRLQGEGAEALPGVDAVARAAAALRAGAIVAVKGAGGYQLACDATSEAAVARLRLLKRRPRKPLGVLAASLDAARAFTEMNPAEEIALLSPTRPLVIVRQRSSRLSSNIAPDRQTVGVLLPPTPLHHLLARDAGVPLVLTSANCSGAPMWIDDAEAERHFQQLADFLLTHDRAIALRCDDSVVRVQAGQPTLLRRARGFVPLPIRLSEPLRAPILAVGGQQHNAVCVGLGDNVWFSPHVGDLDEPETFQAFERAILDLQRGLGVAPRTVAHDLHPDYASTRWAQQRGGVQRVAVQHHHAHVAAVMAEHGLQGPVLGVAYDGTGLGEDGTSWGGEILLATLQDARRLVTLRPLDLPGGEAAIRQPWRAALALVDAALGANTAVDDLRVFGDRDPAAVRAVQKLIVKRVGTTQAHGLGRWFDAFAALGLARGEADHEGELASLWEEAAQGEEAALPFTLQAGEIDLRPAAIAFLADLRAGRSIAALSAAFHATVIAATAAAIAEQRALHGHLPVVLAGGCMQNTRLVEGLLRAVPAPVYRAQHVPPGDGGLALGQLVVAAARTYTTAAAEGQHVYTLRRKLERKPARTAACHRRCTLAVQSESATGLTHRVWCWTEVVLVRSQPCA